MSEKPKLPQTVEEAKSPSVLQWAHEQINNGQSWEFIRKELGLGLAADDKRWREVRRALQSADMPLTEDGSLIELYQKQLDHQEKMLALLKKIEDRVDAGPQDKVIERKKRFANGDVVDLEPVVVPDKTYHHFVRYNMEALEKMMKENQAQFQAFLESKKVKSGNRGGVKINIYSNVPRPERTAVEVQQMIGDDDATGDDS